MTDIERWECDTCGMRRLPGQRAPKRHHWRGDQCHGTFTMVRYVRADEGGPGAVDPAEIVAWLRGRTGAYGGGFTSADDVAAAIERKFVHRRPGGG